MARFDGYIVGRGLDANTMIGWFANAIEVGRAAGVPESKRTTDDIGPDRYWVCTDWLSNGGRKIIGPFDSRELALDVRTFVERAEGHNRYFVDAEGR